MKEIVCAQFTRGNNFNQIQDPRKKKEFKVGCQLLNNTGRL